MVEPSGCPYYSYQAPITVVVEIVNQRPSFIASKDQNERNTGWRWLARLKAFVPGGNVAPVDYLWHDLRPLRHPAWLETEGCATGSKTTREERRGNGEI